LQNVQSMAEYLQKNEQYKNSVQLQEKKRSRVFMEDNRISVSKVIIQKVGDDAKKNDEEATDYLTALQTTNMWGGEPEAHAIANYYGFRVRIYRNLSDMRNPMNYTTVGIGHRRRFSLLLHGNHYQVIDGHGRVIHNPVGDGSCLFEAMFFILRGPYAHNLLRTEGRREVEVRNMRYIAAQWLQGQPQLLNVLEAEYQQKKEDESLRISLKIAILLCDVCDQFPPTEYCIECYRDYYYFKKRNGDVSSRRRLDHVVNKAITEKKVSQDHTKGIMDVFIKNSGYREKEKEIKATDEEIIQKQNFVLMPGVAPEMAWGEWKAIIMSLLSTEENGYVKVNELQLRHKTQKGNNKSVWYKKVENKFHIYGLAEHRGKDGDNTKYEMICGAEKVPKHVCLSKKT